MTHTIKDIILDSQKGCLCRVEGFISGLKWIVKAERINMGFNLFGNYLLCEFGYIVEIRDLLSV